jgi:predicted RNA-binding Zn-ribbon protein involved in translation (DUF1610 family)
MSEKLQTKQNYLPVFGKTTGQMRERVGWCTISNGKLVACPSCHNEVLYLHQKEQYNSNSYMCHDCYYKH